MKKWCKPLISFFAVVVILCASFVPVFASDGLSWLYDWWDMPNTGWMWDYIWGDEVLIEQTERYFEGLPEDDVQRQWYFSRTDNDTFGFTNGGSGGGGSRGSVEVNAYTGKGADTSTVNRSLVTSVNNNNYFNMPTYNTTNNYYNQQLINNTYYNNTYNTYRFETTNVTNNYTTNYFVTYSPTYVNITYLDSNSGNANTSLFFFKLPDGRNSFDLTADEVFGQYFVYNTKNYDLVIEDAKTKALYHMDGNLRDDSANNGSASFSVGGSVSYIGHEPFGSALYLPNGEHRLSFSGASGGTYEFMAYLTQSGSVAADDLAFNYDKTSYRQNSSTTYPTPYPLSKFLSLDSSYILFYSVGSEVYGGKTVDGYSSYFHYYTNITLYFLHSYLLNAGGAGYFPIYEKINLVYHREPEMVDYGRPGLDSHFYTTQWVALSDASLVMAYKNSNGKVVEIPAGNWNSFAVSGGTQYMNGAVVPFKNHGGALGGTVLHKPAGYNNYMYLDEFRVSSGSLYSGNYLPSSEPFDTNKVLVLPSNGSQGDVAIKSNIPVKATRYGGARPTYPAIGDVFVSIEKQDKKHVVDSVQQYQSGGWVNVGGSIYDGSEWLNLKGYNMASYTIEEPPEGGNTGGETGGGTGGDGGSGGETGADWWDKFLEWIDSLWSDDGTDGETGGETGGEETGDGFWLAIGKFFAWLLGGLGKIVGFIVNGVIGIAKILASAGSAVLAAVGTVGAFLGAALGWMPPEITSLIVIGLIFAIILMIIRHFRE